MKRDCDTRGVIPLVMAVLIAVCCHGSSAQYHEDAAATGCAGAGMSSALVPTAPNMNPANLGMSRLPRYGLIVPILPAVWAGYWSDHLAVTPYRELTNLGNDSTLLGTYIDVMLDKSFRTGGVDPEASSKKIMDGVDHGVSLYAGTRVSPLAVTIQRGALTVDTRLDAQVDLPRDLFALVFGNDQGLVEGNVLDFKGISAAATAYSTIAAAYGQPFSCAAMLQQWNEMSGGYLDFSEGTWGVGLDYIIGHAMVRERTLSGIMQVTQRDGRDVVAVDGKAELVTAGGGLSGAWSVPESVRAGSLFPGSGIGVNAGVAFAGPRTTLGFSVQSLGFIHWGDVKKVSYTVRDTAIQLGRLLNVNLFGGDSSVQRGDSILAIQPGENDTLRDAPDIFQSLPTTISLAAGYTFDFTTRSRNVRALSQYTTLTMQYDQSCAPWPGRRYTPRIAVGAENGALFGVVPIRCGFFAGGSERYGSSLGFGINTRYVRMDVGYTAYGTPYFYPKRGFALAANIMGVWGHTPRVRNPSVPVDSDSDGVADTLDKCPLQPEDNDGFEDGDGCPELDNDADGVPDSLDKCPLVAEDVDRFSDDDGCPDFDNDMDGVPDSLDKCIGIAEDIDSVEDDDGCPDWDNDKDNIPDTLDKCINDPETFNGFNDEDGCPDTLVKPTEEETQVLNTKLMGLHFQSNSAALKPESFTLLDFITSFLKKYPYLQYEIKGHTDNVGSDEHNLLLSAARAATVRTYLFSRGIADSSLIAIGYGESQPKTENTTAIGRAQNRRVEFRYIESSNGYQELKARQESFKEQIKAANIKGAQ